MASLEHKPRASFSYGRGGIVSCNMKWIESDKNAKPCEIPRRQLKPTAAMKYVKAHGLG